MSSEIEKLKAENKRLREVVDYWKGYFDRLAATLDCYREVDVVLRRAADLKAQTEMLLKTFAHVHQNNGVNDRCEKCGCDLRHEIHIRTKAK